MKAGLAFLGWVLLADTLDAQGVLTFASVEGPDPVRSVVSGILTEVYSLLNYKIIVDGFPGQGGLLRAGAGDLDGELYRMGGLTAVYPELIQVPTPVMKINFGVFSLKEERAINTWNDLKNLRIGFQRGILFVESHTVGFQTFPVETYDQAYQMLALGRVDVVVASTTNYQTTLERLGLSTIRLAVPILDTLNLYHYLHKKNAFLVPLVDHILSER